LGTGFYSLQSENNQLNAELIQVKKNLAELKKESKNLQDQVDYYQVPENVLKEYRSQFNYKKPGEKMFIIIP